MVSKKLLIGLLVGAAAVTIAVVTVVLVVALYNKEVERIKVKTHHSGTLTGTSTTLSDGVVIYQFHNIKYGQPPVGELRFRPPLANKVDMETEVDATDDTSVKCLQMDDGEGTEDCLVLTVMTPDLSGSALPVMVWIHGGGLIRGHGASTGYSFDADTTSRVGAVTVNINYRLGFLGFASVEEVWEEDVHYANAGIRDLILGLEWVQANIALFGGDPERVLIVGESGGATATMALVGSPLANNLFRVAVALSPAPEVRFDHVKGNEVQRFIVDTWCGDLGTVAERAACLREQPTSSLTMAGMFMAGVQNTLGLGYFDFPMRWGEEGEYLGLIVTDPIVYPFNARDLSTATFTPDSKITVVVSNLREENAYMMDSNNFEDHATLNSTLSALFPAVYNESDVLETVYDLYPDMSAFDMWNWLTSDMRSTCPINEIVPLMLDAPNREVLRLFITYQLNTGTDVIRAFHGLDSLALFGFMEDNFAPYAAFLQNDGLRLALVDMLKGLIAGEGVEGWEEGTTLVLENGDSVMRISDDEPREEVCEELKAMNLTMYGAQNRK